MKKLIELFKQPQPQVKLEDVVSKTKFTSTYPKNRPDLYKWCKEFKFGMVYDKGVRHFG